VVTLLTAAAMMVGIDRARAVCSRKTVSDNLKECPWRFFQSSLTLPVVDLRCSFGKSGWYYLGETGLGRGTEGEP